MKHICRFLLLLFALSTCSGQSRPNLVIIYCDDLGYGDIGPFGATKQKTPALDQMAKEGMRLTDFYSTCSVCTPSRASLMTGCYPRRVNMHQDEKNLCVLFPAARKGLHPDEVTIADLLKTQGYRTKCIGKWHLGDHPDFLPTRQGFDSYLGIPYSNDMNRKEVPLPLVRDEQAIELVIGRKQSPLTERYTKEAVHFIKESGRQPFFLYFPHAAVHNPLFPGKQFLGKSQNGKYGDWVEEIDWSTGQILQAIKDAGVDNNTMVVFTSDNGAGNKLGRNAPLKGKKGRTDEGGMRVPCVVRWPGKIPAGTSSGALTTTMDWLPTMAHLTGTALPDKPIDGHNIWSVLTAKTSTSPYDAFYYYQMDQLQAVRSGKWKLFVEMESKKKNWGKPEGAAELLLYDLDQDIGESRNVAEANPSVVKRLLAFAEEARNELGDVNCKGSGQRKAGWVDTPAPRLLPSASDNN